MGDVALVFEGVMKRSSKVGGGASILLDAEEVLGQILFVILKMLKVYLILYYPLDLSRYHFLELELNRCQVVVV